MFAVEYEEDLAGRPIAIGAAATGDLGRVQDFAFKTLVVSKKPRLT
jgi:hypothetical protein